MNLKNKRLPLEQPFINEQVQKMILKLIFTNFQTNYSKQQNKLKMAVSNNMQHLICYKDNEDIGDEKNQVK